MAVDNDPLPTAASINMNVTDLRDLLNKKRGKTSVRVEEKVKSCWIPTGQIYESPKRCDDRSYFRSVGSSTAFRPKSQQFFGTPMCSNQWLIGDLSHQRPPMSLDNRGLSEIESRRVESKNESVKHKKYQHVSKTPVKETVENQKTRTRFVLPPRKDFDGIWRVAQHRKFPRPLTRTQKEDYCEKDLLPKEVKQPRWKASLYLLHQ